ncbi:major capsid family protein [Methylobacterium variabile]|uniref:major capsid family protein n=1 Tax=Methylobacterium variabile TaxID=298794 RepID=UPI00069EBC87|nr:major capsid family protein [Methylobacterium variabile]
MNAMTPIEARTQFEADREALADLGIHLDHVQGYATAEIRRDYTIAMDALPALQTAATSAIPAMLTTTIDPQVIRVRFTPTKAAEIFGEQKKGDWLQDTVMFPVVEHTGEVSSYGDYANNGMVGVNMNWPQRQNYLYQTISEYGERELGRAGLAGINLVAEKDEAAANVMGRFENSIYFFGVAGLQNYGLLNDPALPASLTPATKAAGGTGWQTTGGAPNATANEVYNDALALFTQLVAQTGGLISAEDEMVLAMSPSSAVALGFINQFNLKVRDALKAEFPRLEVVTAVQYGKQSAANPQGVVAGNMMQLIAKTIDGQPTGYMAFSEKMRSHNLVTEMSSYKKKWSGGAWGAVIRIPYAVASMVGI